MKRKLTAKHKQKLRLFTYFATGRPLDIDGRGLVDHTILRDRRGNFLIKRGQLRCERISERDAMIDWAKNAAPSPWDRKLVKMIKEAA